MTDRNKNKDATNDYNYNPDKIDNIDNFPELTTEMTENQPTSYREKKWSKDQTKFGLDSIIENQKKKKMQMKNRRSSRKDLVTQHQLILDWNVCI